MLKHIVFDFDGVLFNSNKLKLDCFYNIAKQYNLSAIDAFMDYCKSAGGVTADARFYYYKSKIGLNDEIDNCND